MIDPSYGIKIWTEVNYVLSHFTRLTDGRTDGHTDSSGVTRGGGQTAPSDTIQGLTP